MPPWEMASLRAKSADVTFSSYALCETTGKARELYSREVARFTRTLLIDICGEKPRSAQMLADSFDELFTVVERRRSEMPSRISLPVSVCSFNKLDSEQECGQVPRLEK